MEGSLYKTLLILLLVLYTLTVSAIGIRSRKSENPEDYFLASRSLPAWVLAITFIASWWGGGSAIDLVDIAYQQGISSFWIYGVPVLVATFLMYLFAGAIRRASTLSQSEMMEKRYDMRSAALLTLFIIIFMTIGAAVQVIVIGKLFQSFLSIPYDLAALLGTAMVLLYSMFGGFRGVVLTDLFQFVFFLGASLFLFFFSHHHAGGFSALADYSNSHAHYNDFFHGMGDHIAYILTFGCAWMVQANVWQRISAAKSPKSAKHMMIISFIIFVPLYLMVSYTGMFSALMFDAVPEEGIVAALLQQLDNPLLSALLFVGLCSAMMSTMDSLINTGALSLTIDVYARHLRPAASPAQLVWVGRVSTCLIGLIALFIGTQIQSVLTISWIGADFIATGAFIPLTMGFLWKKGSSQAAFYTMIFGLIFSSYNLLAALGVPLPTAWAIASAQQALIGICASAALYFALSLWGMKVNKA